MSKLVQEFSTVVKDAKGSAYMARVRGGELGSMWQGWIEFVPLDGGPSVRTDTETTQSTYEHLQYWASGLSSDYMQMALRRAHPAESSSPPRSPSQWVAPGQPGVEGDEAGVVRLEIETVDPTLPRRLMNSLTLMIGRVRRVTGAGVIVYDGVTAEEGKPSRHSLLVQFGSENAAAVMANHIWSELHGARVLLRVNGRPVELDSHELSEAFKVALKAPLKS